MIKEKKVYPITYLTGLKTSDRERLVSAGVVVLKQLIHRRPEELSRETGIKKADIEMMIERATAILTETK